MGRCLTRLVSHPQGVGHLQIDMWLEGCLVFPTYVNSNNTFCHHNLKFYTHVYLNVIHIHTSNNLNVTFIVILATIFVCLPLFKLMVTTPVVPLA